ncbi:hypothetical protein JTB14_026698 [Gonioctena quinquepunctata]|nr:hypothetical protein JTB14_026698 [Gonioctena quinquepunctata]
MDPGTQAMNDTRADEELYQSKIGSLLYLAMGTIPHIADAVNKSSQFQTDPTEIHMKMVHHIFKYLEGSISKTLIHNSTMNPVIYVHIDASYGDCSDTRRSSSGYVSFYGEVTVIWTSEKQHINNNISDSDTDNNTALFG